VLNGRSYVGAMSQRKKAARYDDANDLAQNTCSAQSANPGATECKHSRIDATSTRDSDEREIDDLDGWPLSVTLRDELQALDLMSQTATPGVKTFVVQVGPREQIAPPLQRFSQNVGATTQAVVMKPFWNLVDYTRAEFLFESILQLEF
jgi:hypothetical protein